MMLASGGVSCRRYLLSELANRMARVWASGSPSLTSAAAFQTQLRSLPTFGDSFISGTTVISLAKPFLLPIARHTVVVGANLQRLVSSHDQSCLAVLLVLQQSNITSSTLSPLVGLLNKLEELCAHLEGLLLEFLVGLDIDFLGEADNGLEVDIL